MKLLNTLFPRVAAFRYIAQTSFEDMEKRHSVRENFNEPHTYAEFMKRYGEIGQRCNFSKAHDTEEILWRSQNLLTLQRAATSLYAQNQFAPASMSRIDQNLKKWVGDLKPKRDPINVTRRLMAGIGRVVQLAFDM